MHGIRAVIGSGAGDAITAFARRLCAVTQARGDRAKHGAGNGKDHAGIDGITRIHDRVSIQRVPVYASLTPSRRPSRDF